MEKTIHQYIKKTHKGTTRNVGVLVGQIDNNGIVSFGWSKVATSKGDRFNRQRGMEIAKGRLELENIIVPHSIKDDMVGFMKRCKRYFKNNVALTPVNIVHPKNQAFVCLNYKVNGSIDDA